MTRPTAGKLGMRALLLAVFSGLVLSGSRGDCQQPPTPSTIRVLVDVPGAPGTKVTLRYLDGPDSLRGKTRELVAPAEFEVSGQPFTLLAQRAEGRGRVRLRVEQKESQLMGEGTGDRVRIEVGSDGLQVRAFPWWLPL